MLEFGSIIAWYRFPAAEEFVFDIFFVLTMRQMFSIGEWSGLQAAPGLFYYEAMLL